MQLRACDAAVAKHPEALNVAVPSDASETVVAKLQQRFDNSKEQVEAALVLSSTANDLVSSISRHCGEF